MKKRNRAHYRGDYARRAKAIRDAANADPGTLCRRCGKTKAQHRPGTFWTAGHVRDGDPTSPLAAEMSNCNFAAGQLAKRRDHEPRSPQWG